MPIDQKGSILPFVGIFVLLLIVGGGSFYYGTHQNKQPQVLQQIPPSIMETSDTQTRNDEWLEYTSQKLPNNSLKAYTIKYPATWSKNLEREPETIDKLTLSNKGYSIEIVQGAMGGGGCIFEGSVPDGPYDDFRHTPYTEFKSNIGTMRRIQAKSYIPDSAAFWFCVNNSKEFYGKPSQVGSIVYNVPEIFDVKILKEMDTIIATLKESPAQ